MDFEPGDVVQLKSGGPPMTVEQVGNEAVSCSWFEKVGNRQQLERETFPPIALTKYEPNSVVPFLVI
jgi:uncharacterized protein YodC (DUF2158 family)